MNLFVLLGNLRVYCQLSGPEVEYFIPVLVELCAWC